MNDEAKDFSERQSELWENFLKRIDVAVSKRKGIRISAEEAMMIWLSFDNPGFKRSD